MNKVELYGRIASIPAVKEYGTDKDFLKVCNFTVVVNRMDKNGKFTLADFIPCAAFGKLGKSVAERMHKGDAVVILGNIRVSLWKDKNGRTHQTFNVICESVVLACKSSKNKKAEKEVEQLPDEIQEFMQLKDTLDEELPFG